MVVLLDGCRADDCIQMLYAGRQAVVSFILGNWNVILVSNNSIVTTTGFLSNVILLLLVGYFLYLFYWIFWTLFHCTNSSNCYLNISNFLCNLVIIFWDKEWGFFIISFYFYWFGGNWEMLCVIDCFLFFECGDPAQSEKDTWYFLRFLKVLRIIEWLPSFLNKNKDQQKKHSQKSIKRVNEFYSVMSRWQLTTP